MSLEKQSSRESGFAGEDDVVWGRVMVEVDVAGQAAS